MDKTLHGGGGSGEGRRVGSWCGCSRQSRVAVGSGQPAGLGPEASWLRRCQELPLQQEAEDKGAASCLLKLAFIEESKGPRTRPREEQERAA